MVPTPPEEIADLMKFIAEKSKDAKFPLTIKGLARQYKEYSGSSRTFDTIRDRHVTGKSTFSVKIIVFRIKKFRLRIHEMNEFDVDTKVKMIFALSAPVDDGFLIELKKVADVEVDDRKRIIDYKKKGGGMELNWNATLRSSPEECSRKLLEFLEKKSKTVNTPIMDYSFLKEFKSATGDQSTLESIRHRYSSAKEKIYKSSKFSKNTKVKMMFISNAKITGNILNELRKCARVEVDEQGRIKKYEAKDGSLKLEGIHGKSSLTMRESHTKMLEFLEEKSKTVNTPMVDTSFVKEFKSATGDQSTFRSLESRYARVKDKIYKSSTIGQDAKIKMMFISNAKISETILNELQKDAVVELDEKQRIKKYEARDGSLSLEGKRGPPVKMRPKKDYWRDSSDSEEEEDSSDYEEREEEDDENMETSSSDSEKSDKEEEERNERIRQPAIGNKSQGQSGIANGERKAESLYLPSGFSEDELSEDDNQSAMIKGRKKARFLYSSSEDSENDGEGGDGGEEVHKRARISYSSSEESEKKLSDEDESEKSMDLEISNVAFGEEDNDYDPPSYNQYDEMLSDSVKMEEERTHQASSTSKTNENPVNATAFDSNISTSSSSSEENSGDESPEKKMISSLSEEIADLMKYIAKESKNVNSPMNIAELARQFKEDSGSSLTVNGIVSRIRKYRLEIHRMNEFDIDTKVKMIFALGAPVDDGFLIELKKVAGVEVDDRQRIVENKKMNTPKSMPEESYTKMLEFLEEKSKTVNTPIMDYSFLKEFKSATGDQSTLNSLSPRYARVKETIYKSSKFNKNTKIKMMFISNAKITGSILNELRKCARVDVDERGRITKYEAKDGSLHLEGVHGKSSSDESYTKMLEFLEEKSQTVNTPMMDQPFLREFKSASGDQSTLNSLTKRYNLLKETIYKSSTIDRNTKIKMLFISNAKITGDFLNELQKDAIVELDKKRRIKKYEAKDGSLNLIGIHGTSNAKKSFYFDRWHAMFQQVINDDDSEVDEEDLEWIKLFRYVIKRTKNVNAPLNITKLTLDYKRESGCLKQVACICERIYIFRQRIGEIDVFDTPTKVRCLFALSATISDDVRKKLEKNAIVELDNKRRIRKYEAKDGSLKLEGMPFDRWRVACQKVINDDNSDEEESDEEEERLTNEYIKLVRYVIERTKNVKAPLRVTKLAQDFKKESGSLERWERLYDRIKTFRQRIGEMDLFDTPTKIRCLFALSATITADVLQELQKDAIVELDDNRRIKKYEAINASLILKGEHGQAAKIRAETEDLEDSSDSEDEESEEEEENMKTSDKEEAERNERIRQPANGNDSESAESQGQSGIPNDKRKAESLHLSSGLPGDGGEGEENEASVESDDFNDDLPDYRHYSDRNPEEHEKEADLPSLTPEPIDFADFAGDLYTSSNYHQNREEDLEQVPIEQDPQRLNETEDRVEDIDQIVAETISDALIIVQVIEQIVELVDVELRAHQIQNRISEDHPKAKRARISYSSSGESEKKQPDEDESEKSMDFGEEDIVYDLPIYEEKIEKSAEERNDDENLSEIGEERSEFASLSSETNQKNPVDITASESNFEENSENKSSEKGESMKPADLSPETINFIDHVDDYEERIQEENSEQVPKETKLQGPLEDQNAALITSQIVEQAAESIEQKPEHLIENVQQERKRARMTNSVPEESINKLKRFCIELKEPKPENLIELPQEIRSEATSVRDILFLLKASLMAIESAKLIGLLKEIESIIEKLDNGSLQVTLDNINDPFELSFFPLIHHLAPKGPTKQETTSLYHFLVSLKTVTFQISNPTIHLLRQKLKTLIGELRVEDKRIPIDLIDIAMKTTIEMITSGSFN